MVDPNIDPGSYYPETVDIPPTPLPIEPARTDPPLAFFVILCAVVAVSVGWLLHTRREVGRTRGYGVVVAVVMLMVVGAILYVFLLAN